MKDKATLCVELTARIDTLSATYTKLEREFHETAHRVQMSEDMLSKAEGLKQNRLDCDKAFLELVIELKTTNDGFKQRLVQGDESPA